MYQFKSTANSMIENKIQQEVNIWTDEFIEELSKRTMEFESGKVKGFSWEEVKARAKQFTKNRQA